MQDEGLGIQSLLVKREAMIAKHIARFNTHPDCLWSRYIRARYGDWSQGSLVCPVYDCLFIWKEICICAPMILDRVRCLIDNGISVDVCQDA